MDDDGQANGWRDEMAELLASLDQLNQMVDKLPTKRFITIGTALLCVMIGAEIVFMPGMFGH